MHAADPPRITSHPQELYGAVPGKPVSFTVRATGMEPLTYQWQWKPTGDGISSEEWQLCDTERFPGAASSTLTISSLQKLNGGSYCCVVSNCAGIQTSKPAKLSVGKIPRVCRSKQHSTHALYFIPPVNTQHVLYTTHLTIHGWLDSCAKEA